MNIKINEVRINSIDFLKGVLILFIIITHYRWKETERLQFLFPFWIDMAIPFFLILSGFVYGKSFQKKEIKSLEMAYSTEYIWKKIIRYTIPFIIVFITQQILFLFIGSTHYEIDEIFILFFRGGTGPGSYYYPIIMQLIFYFPIINSIIQKYQFKGLIFCGFINFLYEFLKFVYEMNLECYSVLVFRYTLVIGYGCYLATSEVREYKRLSQICVGLGFLYIYLFKYMGITPPVTNFKTGTDFFASLFIIPIAGFLIRKNLKNPFISVLGKASYNIYLIQMLYYGGAHYIYAIVPGKILELIVSIFICITLGVVFYYIERPITQRLYQKTYELWKDYSKHNNISLK